MDIKVYHGIHQINKFSDMSVAIKHILEPNKIKPTSLIVTINGIMHIYRIVRYDELTSLINREVNFVYFKYKLDLLMGDRNPQENIFFVKNDVVNTWAKNNSFYCNFVRRVDQNVNSSTSGKSTTNFTFDDYDSTQQSSLSNFGYDIINKFLVEEGKFIHPKLKLNLEEFLREIHVKVLIPENLMTVMTTIAKTSVVYDPDELESVYNIKE